TDQNYLASYLCRYDTHQWNSPSRKGVDDRFLHDMLDHCATRSVWLRTTCRWWAQVFYAAVRLAGGP
ncbi:MAG: phospholipase A2, partial [Ilumatobacteraceae bacterium]